MMRVFLIEKQGGRKIDLGLFKFNDELRSFSAAKKKHKFIEKMETHSFDLVAEQEHGPLRRPKPEPRRLPEQASLIDSK